jgi:hypothetical protein
MLMIYYPDVGIPGGRLVIITRVFSWESGFARGSVAPGD